jgi:hypothetical protein
MKKFLTGLCVFFLPILAAAMVLFLLPVDRKYAYNFISRGGCQGRPPWIYKQIFESEENIDIAFVGTSHTMNAVDDKVIQQSIIEATHAPLVCKNISFCGFGRDFDYIIIKDLLLHKKPKLVVLEIRENEGRFSHSSFACVADARDLFGAPKFINRSYFPDLYKALLFRLQYVRELVTHEDIKRETDISPSPYRFNGTANTADTVELVNHLADVMRKNRNGIPAIENLLDKYPMAYIKRIADLVKQHNVRMVFLYIPSYAGQSDTAAIVKRYSPFGKVILADADMLAKKSNWMDFEHMNIDGAERLSEKAAKELTYMIH